MDSYSENKVNDSFLLEYNSEQQQNLFSELTGINENILFLFNGNNINENNISSIFPPSNNFISCKENSINICLNYSNNNNNFVNNINKEDKEDNVNLIKKNKFIIFNLFNLKGKSQDLKDIRNFINKVIYEKIKKENKNNLFNITQKKDEKDIKIKRKRKYKPDDIRKKIKSRFLKALKNRINEELKYANSTKYFDFLPQCFICEITKKKNKEILNMTLR